ncbi:MAG: SDR family NAD(P)-dependent oxidoreductase [Candidatus Aminicenantes bacterium]|nr:SDR family NAD(P)-dependent oxidoreductase [Candidatus Aminicenantes bacterium]
MHMPNNGKRILVTGGAGYIGSILVTRLLDAGYKVIILDKLMFGVDPLRHFLKNPNPNLAVIVGDIQNEDDVNRAVENADAVIHLAAIVGDPACAADSELAVNVNFNATVRLADICKRHKIQRFIFASTCSVYGMGKTEILTEDAEVNPVSLYAETRLYGERGILSLADKNFSPVLLRLGTLFGLSPRMRFDIIINYLTQKAVRENKISIFGGNQWRPLLHVADAARAFQVAMEGPLEKVENQIFNVGMANLQIKEIGRIIQQNIPEAEVQVLDKFEDKRSYNVSFEKIEAALQYKAEITIEVGIKEIAGALKDGTIADPTDKIYYNHYAC